MLLILARKVTPELLERTDKLPNAKLIVDEETSIDDDIFKAGFTHLNTKITRKSITAWERGLYYAWKHCKDQKYIWFMEDDVYCRTGSAIAEVMKSYDHSTADLISTPIATSPDDLPRWPHWGQGHGFFERDTLAASFNVFCRLSRKLIVSLAKMAKEHGRLCFLEVLFASRCKEKRLQVAPLHSERLMLRYRPPFSPAEIQLLEKHSYVRIFHPVKV